MENTHTEVLEERIKGMQATLKAEFDVLHVSLNYIKDQTTKTNGSVARVIERIDEVEKKQAVCPADDFKTFKTEMEVLRFYSKYPGLLKFTIMGIFFLNIVIGGIIIYTKLK